VCWLMELIFMRRNAKVGALSDTFRRYDLLMDVDRNTKIYTIQHVFVWSLFRRRIRTLQSSASQPGAFWIKDLKVGSPLQKTISGGQRSDWYWLGTFCGNRQFFCGRAHIWTFLTETQKNIMDLLKSLTLRGKMIFVVIHQPSSEFSKMFDGLLILDVGGSNLLR